MGSGDSPYKLDVLVVKLADAARAVLDVDMGQDPTSLIIQLNNESLDGARPPGQMQGRRRP